MRGMDLFFTNTVGARGNCATCHQGPLFTTATFPFTEEPESGEFPEREQLVERMRRGDGVNVAENLFRYFIQRVRVRSAVLRSTAAPAHGNCRASIRPRSVATSR